MQIFVRIVASDVEEVVQLWQVEKAEVVRVVGKQDGGNFASADVKEIADVLGSGTGIAEDVLGLGEYLGDVVAEVGSEGRKRIGKAQRNEIVDGDDVATVGK